MFLNGEKYGAILFIATGTKVVLTKTNEESGITVYVPLNDGISFLPPFSS